MESTALEMSDIGTSPSDNASLLAVELSPSPTSKITECREDIQPAYLNQTVEDAEIPTSTYSADAPVHFKTLPLELQLQIWGIAVNSIPSRIVEVQFSWFDGQSHPVEISSHEPSGLLRACKDSRKEYLRVYKELLPQRTVMQVTYDPQISIETVSYVQPGMWRKSPICYFNNMIDVLFISMSKNPMDERFGFTSYDDPKALQYISLWRDVRFIAISYTEDVFADFLASAFPNLEIIYHVLFHHKQRAKYFKSAPRPESIEVISSGEVTFDEPWQITRDGEARDLYRNDWEDDEWTEDYQDWEREELKEIWMDLAEREPPIVKCVLLRRGGIPMWEASLYPGDQPDDSEDDDDDPEDKDYESAHEDYDVVEQDDDSTDQGDYLTDQNDDPAELEYELAELEDESANLNIDSDIAQGELSMQ